jgi:hypothetical protein
VVLPVNAPRIVGDLTAERPFRLPSRRWDMGASGSREDSRPAGKVVVIDHRVPQTEIRVAIFHRRIRLLAARPHVRILGGGIASLAC